MTLGSFVMRSASGSDIAQLCDEVGGNTLSYEKEDTWRRIHTLSGPPSRGSSADAQDAGSKHQEFVT